MRALRPAGVCLIIGLTWTASASGAAGQSDSVSIVPGIHYVDAPLDRDLLGQDYRDLWGTSIRAEVLSLTGLTPLRRGGGRQTSSLRFTDSAGREFSFRSIDKVPAYAVHPDLEGALFGELIQDQVSSLAPGAPVVAGRIAGAVGIPHPDPRIVVMPDDPVLGEFREEFAGKLGTFEQHVDEAEGGGPGFGGFTTIVATETLLEHLEEDPRHRVDAGAYLQARLVDLILGDWDRHEDQWRWIRHEVRNGFVWVPVPRDRDYALANYDGRIFRIVRRFVPNAVSFGESITELDGLLLNARDLDRRILAGLTREVWDSVVARVTTGLTDAKIESAVHALPVEFTRLRGERIARTLQARRDDLPRVADLFYREIADVPEIRATDEDEVATIRRNGDGSVEVEVTIDSLRYFHRSFSPSETREIRLYLRGGDDRSVISGVGTSPIVVRVVGGGGTDVLVDSSRVTLLGTWASLHDDGEDDRLIGGSQTTIVRAEHQDPFSGRVGLVRISPDDRPRNSMSLRPAADYSSTTGLMIGGRVSFTERGFRRYPFAGRTSLELLFAPRWSSFGTVFETEFRGFDPSRHAVITATASAIDALRFYGFGNESTDELPTSAYRFRRDLYEFDLRGFQRAGSVGTVSIGLVARHSVPHLVEGSPLEATEPLGARAFTSAGLLASAAVAGGSPDSTATVFQASIDGSYHPVVPRGAGGFGKLNAFGAVSSPVASSPLRAVLRAGGAYAWGDYPFFEAAFVGGSDTLRGYPSWRFAGGASAFGSAEISAQIARLPFIMNWRVHGHTFIDVGRVFERGESSGAWHYAPGAGLTLSAMSYHVNLTYAYGSKSRIYLKIGVPPGDLRPID